MNILRTIGHRISEAIAALRGGPAQINQRGYSELIGSTGVNADWLMNYASEEADVFQNAFALTSRCRDLLRTNTTYQKVRELLISNVFGPNGVMCLMDIREAADRQVTSQKEKASFIAWERKINRLRREAAEMDGRSFQQYRAFKLADYLDSEKGMMEWSRVKNSVLTVEAGTPNIYANTVIQDAWKEWQRREYSDIRGRSNYKTHRHLRLMSAVRDGDSCIRTIKDVRVNKFGFALQLINAEWLDRFYNGEMKNGNVVRMGIEYQMTPWGLGKAVAFYFIKRQPRDWQTGARGTFGYFSASGESPLHHRVTADEVIHYARAVDTDNTRPAPWLASTIMKARHLDQYLLYEVICAREACTKVGYLYSDLVPEGGIDPDKAPNPEDIPDEGLSPGQTKGLPYGVKYQERNPSHPNGNAETFRKMMLRDQCAGTPGVPYSALAGDFENINFSAGRLEKLVYTDEWKILQTFDSDYAEEPIFEGFLEMFLLSGLTDLPFANIAQYNKPCHMSRRWAGVDEIKEAQASALRVGNNISCLADECAERGIIFERNAIQRAEERSLLRSLGLPTDPTLTGAPPTTQDPNYDPDNTEDPNHPDYEGGDNEDMDPDQLKAMADAYGIGVRAGVITPNVEDEIAIRQRVGLPEVSDQVRKAWDNDGGARKPITLQGQKAALKDSGLNNEGGAIEPPATTDTIDPGTVGEN